MTRDTTLPKTADFLVGGGEMGERMRAFDWSKTPVGPAQTWPRSLKAAVSICLGSRYPIVIWWGNPAYTMFYNDAYIPILGVTKHPGWLGRSGRECWSDIWHVMGPMWEGVFATGEATWSEDFLYVLNRNIPKEEGYFTFSYSPIRDDAGKVGGIFCACNETTSRVIGERRLRTLRDLGKTVAESETATDACAIAAQTLAADSADIPFALIYLLDDEGRQAHLEAATGVEAGSGPAPDRMDVREESSVWPFRRVSATAAAEQVTDLSVRFGKLPGGPWPESPESALVLPIAAPGQARPTGFLVAGLSPRRVIDADYRGFFDLIAGHLGIAVANARAYEEERRRAEALAELDRAKTAFFSNVSHEFRTPLTLILGPVEDALTDAKERWQRDRLDLIHRNALRLQKLVNTLLDFSRIEAGRIQASYEPTDLAALTSELASVFRSAVEKAGMRLIVNCPPLGEPVYVDRDMYEKIVLNLLSNAFKFTLEGEIEVRLQECGRHAQRDGEPHAERADYVELSVRDTGTGIAQEQLPHVFERFHRVEGARARTHEGTGIGLALVQELVKLHGGTVSVWSVAGQGSTFTVTLPKGKAHLPADRIGAARQLTSTALTAGHYLEEVSRGLPSEIDKETRRQGDKEIAAEVSLSPCLPVSRSSSGPRPRIVWADDNADMRDYVGRLLSPLYDVEAVADGTAALAAVRRQPPDLILADVMMPRLDGFALLRELRADPHTLDLPVILLSARAGEESRVEGMEAGADDYLVKPFGARELLTRVGARLEMARIRREAQEAQRQREEQLRMALTAAEMGSWRANLRTGLGTRDANLNRILGHEPVETTQPIDDCFRLVHPDDKPAAIAAWKKALATKGVYEAEFRLVRDDGSMRWLREQGRFIAGKADQSDLLTGVTLDITERKRAENLAVEQKNILELVAAGCPLDECLTALTGAVARLQPRARAAILLADEARAKIADVLAQDIPLSFGRGIQDVPINDLAIGTCGTAINRGEPIACTDIANDEKWSQPWRELYLAHGIRACHSEHVLNAAGQAVASFMLCFADARQPSEWELRIAEFGAHVARLVLERDRAARALRESEERFRALADNMSQFAWMADEKGWVFWYNQRWYDYTGTTLEEMQGWGWKKVHHPDHVERVVRRIQHSWDTGEVWEDTFPLRGKEGEYRWFLSRAIPIRDAQGRVLRWFGTNTDVTEQRAAQEALREADRRKDEFLATLAHELRNPLAPIRNSLHILRLAASDGGAAARVHEMMERQVNHMVRLVDDLMEVSRITRGKIELRREQVELAAVVRSAVETSKPLIEAARHQFAISLPAEPLMLEADPVRLAQVVANLLNNAAKYTEEEGQIWLTAQRKGANAVVSVRDTGMGIPADMLPKVFDLFTQVDRTHNRAQGGLGIGLTLVRSLVEMHGGSVEARSDGSGRGSEFVVRLPLAAERLGAHDEGRRDAQSAAVAPRRILVVDDNRDAADSLSMLLKYLGADVFTVHDGPTALAALGSYQPSVMLLDIGMPGMDGYEVARRARRQPEGRDVTLIALSGWGQEEDRRRSKEAGIDHHLVKPVDLGALQALLASLPPRHPRPVGAK